MLVVSRKKSESILIGPDIVVTVVKIDRGVVRIGIAAPKEVVVLREELVAVPEETREVP
jgi:carbon storage regulator